MKNLYHTLCNHFNIYPTLVVDHNIGSVDGGYFHAPNGSRKYGEIAIGPNPNHGWKALLVHEFAHAVEYKRNGHRTGGHDRKFYTILLEVISIAYTKPSYYKWTHDYKRIQAWAIKDGFFKGKK